MRMWWLSPGLDSSYNFLRNSLIWSKLNARTGIRTRYLEKSTLVFIREIPLKIFQISSKKKLAKFFDKNKIRFFFDFFSKDVFITLLRGPKTMRKIYRVFFEKLRNPWKNFRKKSSRWFWRNILKKRIFRFFSANIPKDVQKHIF